MHATVAILVLAAFAQAAAAGQQQPSGVARGVAEREANLKKQIAAVPTDSQAYLDLAKLQEDFGAVADAEATLLKARQALATNKSITLALAAFYNRRGQFEKTLEMLHSAARLDPADPSSQHTIATYYWDKAYRDKTLEPAQRATYVREGIAAADRALAIKPDYMEAVVYKGLLLRMRAELTADPAEKSRIIAEAQALRKRGAELQARQAATLAPQPSSTTAAAPPPPPQADGVAPVRVGGNIKPPARIRNVPPVYPAEAAAAKVQGAVIIEATIGADGSVSSTKVLRSVATLDQAALDAVRQWVYEPTYLNGQAVPVIMTVTVNFKLD